MKKCALLPIVSTLLLGQQISMGLDFYLDMRRLGSDGYEVTFFLEATASDFDDFTDGYQLLMPDGQTSAIVSDVEPEGQGYNTYGSFDEMAGAVFGNWQLAATLFGFPLDTQSVTLENLGVTGDDFPEARLFHPAPDAGIRELRPTFRFSGPIEATFLGVLLVPPSGAYPDGGFSTFDSSITEWQPDFDLVEGAHQVFVNYSREAGDGEIAVSRPLGIPFSPWIHLHSSVLSTFTVEAGNAPELRISGPEVAGNALKWSFPTTAGRTYTVEYRDDSAKGPQWQTFDVIAGTGIPASFSVQPTPPPASRYFRVRQE